MKDRIRSNMWRWWCGGGVIGVAVVLGCATAVDFKHSGREAGMAAKQEVADAHIVQPLESTNASLDAVTKEPRVKRGVAGFDGEPHNGGKQQMPITASFDDGESVQTVTRDKVVVVSITADAEVTSLQGLIEGFDGLEGIVRQPLDFTSLKSGENQLISVAIPAKTGSLAVRINGIVNGQMMDANLELKIVNPKEVRVQSTSSKPADMQSGVIEDGTGMRIQPMKATEN
jgi:hypothetical protein